MILNTRIQKIIDYSGLSASEFADEIGVQRSSISHILSGRNKPSLDFITKIKERFPEIQWEWIIEGKGTMTLLSPTPSEIMESKFNTEEENIFEPIPNLFSNAETNELPKNKTIISPNRRELNISIQDKDSEEISDSQRLDIKEEKSIIKTIGNQENKIKKIVFFYENGKFEVFEP